MADCENRYLHRLLGSRINIVGYFNQYEVLGFRSRLFAFTEVTENTSLMSVFLMLKTKEFLFYLNRMKKSCNTRSLGAQSVSVNFLMLDRAKGISLGLINGGYDSYAIFFRQ